MPTLRSLAFAAFTLLAATLCLPAAANTLSLPLTVSHGLVANALAEQLLAPDGQPVTLYADSLDCNRLVLSEPRVEGTEDGLFRVLVRLEAQIGTPVGKRCLLPVSWQGVMEAYEQPVISADGGAIEFRITDSNILQADETPSRVTGVLWGWVKSHVHPRLEAVTLDLRASLATLGQLLGSVLPQTGEDIAASVDTLTLNSVTVGSETLELTLSLEIPEFTPPPPADDAPLDADELARWDTAWQAWDGFATWLIKALATQPDFGITPEMTAELAEILLDARHELRDALAGEDRSHDPVRELFLGTWSRLEPLLRTAQEGAPAQQALRYATFVTAADALQTLDAAGQQLGIRLDSATLRSLARLIVPLVSDADLAYSTAVDPDLRALLGFEADFPVDGETDPENAMTALLRWLMPQAHAANLDPKLIKRLNGWVPGHDDLDDYLEAMDQLLDAIIRAERENGKVPTAHLRLYEHLVRATAWQETCWRQFVRTNGGIEPIRSSAGSVGLMQVNQHVWRGVYDLDALRHNVGYNARAGNEILVHYLVDYAIRKKEHEITGSPDNLARASYAIYNGGPKHLSRYRNPNASAGLKKVDAAFWKKYQAIKKEGAVAVRQCYGG